ncbi:MAG: hypothetical protein LBR53_04765 [Deltaproteobacteria bacterium]|nr:hypothetical protein [Deltaproteobacteria bacterium]
MDGLLKELQTWWAANAARYHKNRKYNKTSKQVLLSAFLQRFVRGYADIVALYKSNKYVTELKQMITKISLTRSMNQHLGYMDSASVTEGWLIVFDMKSDKKREEIISWDTVAAENGKTVHIPGY